MMLQQAIENARNSDSHTGPSSHALFVVPHGREGGFQASIRGHILDLADPNSGHGLAPTPEDLFIASIASELARSARRFLRARGLPVFVSVSAKWQTPEDPPSLVEIDLTLTVSKRAEAASAVLAAAFANGLATRSLAEPVVQSRSKE